MESNSIPLRPRPLGVAAARSGWWTPAAGHGHAPAVALAAAWLVAAGALAAALHAWRGVSYWEYSEGVYALTARMLLEGSTLYGDVVAAQPPTLYLVGAAILATVGDSVEALRAALAVPLVATGALVAVVVWRLTRSAAGAALGGLAAMVAPWTLHEGTLLMPETFAAPLLLGAALLASSERGAPWSGALAALAVSLKLAFVLPAAALAVVARRRARFALGVAAAGGALATVFLALYGGDLVENVVVAQLQTGAQAPRRLAGLLAQAGWNLAPLAVLAGLGIAGRERLRDPGLLRATAGLALGCLALVVTLSKHGSYLNVLAVVEPPLVALAACGAVGVARTLRRPVASRRIATATAGGALAFAAVVLLAAQSTSLLDAPERPTFFAHPLSEAPHGHAMAAESVARAAATAACPARPGHWITPYLAFVAGRAVPAGQPDRFIAQHAEVHAALRPAVVRSARGPACRP